MPSAPVVPLQAKVLGGGPTGSLCALALAQAGWRVFLCDPLSAEALQSRARAYAFTHSSRRLLENLSLWAELEPHLVPFRQLQLHDAALRRWLPFSSSDLPSTSRRPGRAVGWIGRHSTLMALLLERLAQHPAVFLQLGVHDGGMATPPGRCDLVVAADGPSSPARTALGIRCWGWSYDQSCLTAELDLRAAEGTAWELLRPEGPSALLPLGDHRFQLVWSAPASRHQRREALSSSAFLDELAAMLPEGLEPEALHQPPKAFPVALQLAHRLSSGHTVLVGESAHRCHPVGGQGLNLCWRDVAVLHQLAARATAGRLPVDQIGRAYGRRRWPDLLLILLSTDLLVRLFSNRHPFALALRRTALGLLARVAPLRRISLGVMTDGMPDLRGA